MKILYLSDVALEIVGGAQESMKVVINELKNEFNFKIITPKCHIKNEFDTIQFEEYNDFHLKTKSLLDYIKIIRFIKNIIKNEKFDIIHTQMPSTMKIIGILKWIGLIDKKTKIIYTDRGILNSYGKISYYCIKVFSKKFDKIILTTNDNKELYINSKDFENEKLQVIYNTAGKMFEIYEDELRKKNKSIMGFNNDEITIMFAGRMNADKNWGLAVEIVNLLSEYKNIKFIVAIGSDKSEAGINECGLIINEMVNYVGRERIKAFIDINLREMNNLYYSNDIFILTSRVEPFGRTAVEAMSRKNIVFGTRIEGLKEVIKYDENLYESSEEVLEKIKKYISNQQLMDKEKEKFYNRFNENYSLERNIQNHRELYKKIMN